MKDTNVVPIFTAASMDASANQTSDAINMNHYKPERDKVTFQIHLAGTAGATVTFTVLVGHTKSGTYNAVANETEIVADQALGDATYSFTPPIAPFIKIKAEETAGQAVSAMTVTMAIR